MEFETTSEDQDVVVVEGPSDPITPLSPKDLERLTKIRDKYLKAGLLEDKTPKSNEPGPSAKGEA